MMMGLDAVSRTVGHRCAKEMRTVAGLHTTD
jgi:hypothetical protein